MVILVVVLGLVIVLETALLVHILRVVMGDVQCEQCAKLGIGPKS
jgi:hypothetical protein